MKIRLVLIIMTLVIMNACVSNKPKVMEDTVYRNFDVVPKKIQEENRLALVIGNQKYQFFSTLNNPLRDAKDMSEVLRKKGFEVISLANATQFEMQSAIEKFSYKLKQGGTGLFYYAGHGVEVEGANYLLPIDSRVPSRVNKSNAIPLDSILAGMEQAKNRFNIAILDACRSRPDGRGGGGLASVNSANGVFVAYATYPGGISEDGVKGGNGLYTKHLLQQLNEPLNITDVFNNVGYAVNNESIDKKQRPWTSSSMYGKFYFTLPSEITPRVVKPNVQKAKVSKLEKECDLNNAISCYNLGVIYHYGRGIKKNSFQALTSYSKACDLNDGLACTALGFLYWDGKIITVDNEKASNLYAKGCRLNDIQGCYNLGVLYRDGEGIPQNKPKALNLFSKSCEKGHNMACTNLGDMYLKDIDIQKNAILALNAYKKSCDRKYGRGCNALASMYFNGIGIPKDQKRGFKLISKACKLNSGMACFNMGNLFRLTQKELSKSFYEKACNLGVKEACQKF